MEENTIDLGKVTIVLPTYNGAQHIRKSVESCLRQTYRNVELIVVDDGSTDGTLDVVRSCIDERIKILSHGVNRGLPNALNAGFRLSSGDFLTWTSDDNIYSDDAIEIMVNSLTESKGVFVYCDYMVFDSTNPAYQRIVRLPRIPRLSNGNCIGPCFLYARIVAQRIGDYDLDAVLAEDYDYWIRVSKEFNMLHLRKPVYHYREHVGSLSSRFSTSYEVGVASLLVRLKNNVVTVDDSIHELVQLVATKNVLLEQGVAATFLVSAYKWLTRLPDLVRRKSLLPNESFCSARRSSLLVWTWFSAASNRILQILNDRGIRREEERLRRGMSFNVKAILEDYRCGKVGLIDARTSLVRLAHDARRGVGT